MADDIILHIEKFKEHTHTHKLGLINEFNKVVGYKVNIQKSITFIYTSNKIFENGIKNTIQFTPSKGINT